ncbi:MAG: InlB B-repeat-containing protein [Solobacterium sp.]|nr:InlB B-repeat-containing protein [Solobacterium sp.]
MKRIMSILTAVFMSIGLLSVNVKAEGDPYIFIGGTRYDGTEASGEGWIFSRVGSEATLTLSGANISGTATLCGIEAYDMNLTIVLIGSNTVTGTNDYKIGIYVYEGDLTIQGDGSLNASGDIVGISVDTKKLTITGNCTVTATANNGYAMLAAKGITIGDGLGIVSPEGGRIRDDGQFIVNKDNDVVKSVTIGPVPTVTFDANGGTPATITQTIPKGGKATEPDPAPTLEKFYLWDWYETADHSGDPVDFSTKTFDSNTTLYAAWAKRLFFSAHNPTGMGSNEYGGYVKLNGSTFSYMVTQRFKDDTLTLSALPYEGYGFIGFAYSEDGEIITDQMPYTIVNDGTWEEIYALFGPLKTITFVDEDGTVLQESEVPAGKTPEYPGDTPTKKEDKNYTYTFAGWSPEITEVTDDATYTATYTKKKKASDSNNSSNNTNNTAPYTPVQPAPETDTYTPPVTPAPAYRPVTPTVTYYTVTFDTDGGTEIAAQSVQAGDTAYRPADPAKDGYTFAGWYTDKEFSTEFLFSEPVNKAMTVYAKWEEEKVIEPEPEPAVTDEPEPTDAPEPVTPEKKGNGLLYGGIAAVLALLGILFGVMRRKG